MKHHRVSRYLAVTMAAAQGLAACSQSSINSAVDTAGATTQHIMAPLVQKDASRQAQKLIDMLADRPECELFKLRLREAGEGSPTSGATEYAMTHAFDDAGKAGCGKP